MATLKLSADEFIYFPDSNSAIIESSCEMANEYFTSKSLPATTKESFSSKSNFPLNIRRDKATKSSTMKYYLQLSWHQVNSQLEDYIVLNSKIIKITLTDFIIFITQFAYTARIPLNHSRPHTDSRLLLPLQASCRHSYSSILYATLYSCHQRHQSVHQLPIQRPLCS